MRLISLAVCWLLAFPALAAAAERQTGPDALHGQHDGPASALPQGSRLGAALRQARGSGVT
jgi:hypothetical protein